MSFDPQSYQDFIRSTVQSEDHYWNQIEEVHRALLIDKEKEKYVPTLDCVSEILKDKYEKGKAKQLALRLLGTSTIPQDSPPVNTEFVTKLLKHKATLEILTEICQYKRDIQDDRRGETMFQSEGREVGDEYLRYGLEFIRSLASTWEKTKTKSGDQVPTQFNIIYNQLLNDGVKFPDKFEFFEETKKRKPPGSSKAQPSKVAPSTPVQQDINQVIKESFELVESFLHTIHENQKIEEFVKESIEVQEALFLEELKTLTNAINAITDQADERESQALFLAFNFYEHLTQTISQLKQKSYAEKTYGAFRKKLLPKAEECYAGLWKTPADIPKQIASAFQNNDQNGWGGGGFGEGFGDFGNQNGNQQHQNFGEFNFEEQKNQEEQEEQIRRAQRMEEDSRIAAELARSQKDEEQKYLDKQMKGSFDQGFGGGFDNGFGVTEKKDEFRGSGGFGGFDNNFGFNDKKTNEKPTVRFEQYGENQDTRQDFNNQGFGFNDNQTFPKRERDESPDFQYPKQKESERFPANPKQDSYFNNNNNRNANQSTLQDSRRAGGLRDSFIDFSDLSKSDISARDFPLRNSVIQSKEYRGRFHPFNKDVFQVLQDYNLSQQIVRRFKIANLKSKCPLLESSEFQVGVISERIYDTNSSRYLIRCDIFFGNKTLYKVENFSLDLEGDTTTHLYVKNDKFPEVIESNKQFKLQGLLSYSKSPYSLINANVEGRINGKDFGFTIFLPNLLTRYVHFIESQNHMQFFRTRWRQKRDQIIKSDSFPLNKKVIRTPIYFKRYFPQFAENMTIEEFVNHNKNMSAAPISYKLRGTIELDIQNIQYMLKFIVRPNFTAIIQIIPFSGYVNTAEALIDHFVFLFSQR